MCNKSYSYISKEKENKKKKVLDQASPSKCNKQFSHFHFSWIFVCVCVCVYVKNMYLQIYILPTCLVIVVTKTYFIHLVLMFAMMIYLWLQVHIFQHKCIILVFLSVSFLLLFIILVYTDYSNVVWDLHIERKDYRLSKKKPFFRKILHECSSDTINNVFKIKYIYFIFTERIENRE